jgi:uncharacterized membrane protein YhaH (DUF805 family)
VSYGEAGRSVLTTNYASFAGRATRSEYWWFQLFNVLVIVAVYVVLVAVLFAGRSYTLFGIIAGGLVIYALATFIPNLAVTVRRLHDSDKSGWWLLISFVPYIGAIVLFIFMLLPSSPGMNQFGPPHGTTGEIRRVNYRAPTPSESWQRYTEDAQRAAANGYEPVSQQWRRDSLGDYLEVVYQPTFQSQWQTPTGWLSPGTSGRHPFDGPAPKDSSGVT